MPTSDSKEDEILEAIYDALDRNEPEEALVLAERALEGAVEEDPVLRFLAGVALLELDHPTEAAEQLRAAVEADADDAEFRSSLALALFRACRFDEALVEAERAIASDPELPDAHFVLALLLERKGALREAEDHLALASRIDPDRFPPVVRLNRQAFEKEIANAAEKLPDRFRQRLGEVTVLVEDLPAESILLEENPPLDPELLGLFVGESLKDRSHFSTGGQLPPRILLFQRNLERYADNDSRLREEIAVTLYHELGHYLGLDEAELQEIDLD